MAAALPHGNIEPPPGAHLDDPALAAIFAEIQHNFDALSGKFPVSGGDLGSRVVRALGSGSKLAYGTSALVFATFTTASNITTVTHGLGAAPLAVVATAVASPAFTNIPIFNVVSLEKATFGLNGETKAACGPGTIAFNWFAIG